MSLSQKVIIGGAVIVFVIGIGWALQYVSNNDLSVGKGNGTMVNISPDEERSDIQNRSAESPAQPVFNQSAVSDSQQSTDPTSIESRVQAEQALLEIDSAFGEIEADIDVSE